MTDLVDLYQSVSENCPHLNLCGLMTIGKYDYDESLGPNPDFLVSYPGIVHAFSVCIIVEIKFANRWHFQYIRYI